MSESPAPYSARRSAEASRAAADRVARALIRPLYEGLVEVPHQVRNPESLAAQLSASLGERLVANPLGLIAALTESGAITASNDGGLPAETESRRALSVERDPSQALVLAALRGQPAGRSPGLTPDALLALTGLEPAVLGLAVSALVQAGELVRDAWLVRLPETGDLLVSPGTEEVVAVRRAPTEQRGVDRRAIGDRRAMGERRLFDRRQPPG